jgi:hypothetical protein
VLRFVSEEFEQDWQQLVLIEEVQVQQREEISGIDQVLAFAIERLLNNLTGTRTRPPKQTEFHNFSAQFLILRKKSKARMKMNETYSNCGQLWNSLKENRIRFLQIDNRFVRFLCNKIVGKISNGIS